ncbi:A-kinase anchor protein 17B-like isoform X2 [Lissotriton helveticus]
MLPELQDATMTFSNQDIIDQLKDTVSPDQFRNIKVSESTKEFIRLEGEADTKGLAQAFLAKLHESVIKLNGLTEVLKVEVKEDQINFPFKQSWESSLQATKELKENEEPEDGQKQDIPSSLYLEGLPCQWFLSTDCNGVKPSVDVLKQVFETFGTVRVIDIPMLESCAVEVSGEGCDNATLGCLDTFEAFIQYEDSKSLRKAMESLRGMQLIFKGEDGKSVPCNMKVMLDTTNHFSEEVINQRNLEKIELLEEEQHEEQKEEKDERKGNDEERTACEETQETQNECKTQQEKDLEEKPSETVCHSEVEDLWIDGTAEWEERKLVLAQRRVESMKLLTTLLEKVQEYIILDNFSKELLLNFDVDKDTCQSTKVKSVKNAERISEIVLSDELDWEVNSEIHLLTEENDSNYEGEGEEEENENEHKGELDIEDKSCLSISSSVSSYDLSITTSSEEMESQSPERKPAKAEQRKRSYKCGALQMAMHKINHQTETQTSRGNWLSYSGCGSGDTNEAVCYKKPKIYETDEFIHYLLNYYEYPAYARVCLVQNNTESDAWWQRVVFNNGNGFQISLMNLCGQPYNKMNASPSPKQLSPKLKSKWRTTLPKSENLFGSKSCQTFTKDLHRKWAHAENILRSVKQKNTPFKKPSAIPLTSCKGRQNKTQKSYQQAAEASELKDVLEKISSDSEYFSEELENLERKPKRVCKEDCQVACKKVPAKKRTIFPKRRRRATIFPNTIKDETNDPEEMFPDFGLQFSNMYSNLKSHCRCKRKQKWRRPNSIQQSEEQNSESESTDEEEIAQANINGKKIEGNCPTGGAYCCSDNAYHNHLCNLQKDSWKKAYLQRVIERRRRTEHKVKLKLTPHLLGAADHPFQMCHRGLRSNQQDTSVCAATCKHREEPSCEYCSDSCECLNQPIVRNSLENIKPFSFCPRNFNDYLKWQRCFYDEEDYASIS